MNSSRSRHNIPCRVYSRKSFRGTDFINKMSYNIEVIKKFSCVTNYSRGWISCRNTINIHIDIILSHTIMATTVKINVTPKIAIHRLEAFFLTLSQTFRPSLSFFFDVSTGATRSGEGLESDSPSTSSCNV
jgi:hypothetical protein